MQIPKGVRELESLGPLFPWLCLRKATGIPVISRNAGFCLRAVEEGALGVAAPWWTPVGWAAELEAGGPGGGRGAGDGRQALPMGIFGPPISYLRELVPIRAGRPGTCGQVMRCTGSWAQGRRGQKSSGSGHQCLEKTGHVSLAMWAGQLKWPSQVPGGNETQWSQSQATRRHRFV